MNASIPARVLSIVTELFHAPVQLSEALGAELFQVLSKATPAKYKAWESDRRGKIRLYSEHPDQSISEVEFQPGRVTIVERGLYARGENLERAAQEVASTLFDILKVPQVDKQTVTKTVAFLPDHCEDGRFYVLENVCNHTGRLMSHFGRPVSGCLVQISFSEAPSLPGDFRLTVRPSPKVRREVLLEVMGSFDRVRIERATVARTAKNVARVREYMAERGLPFLKQFDVPLGVDRKK